MFVATNQIWKLHIFFFKRVKSNYGDQIWLWCISRCWQHNSFKRKSKNVKHSINKKLLSCCNTVTTEKFRQFYKNIIFVKLKLITTRKSITHFVLENKSTRLGLSWLWAARFTAIDKVFLKHFSKCKPMYFWNVSVSVIISLQLFIFVVLLRKSYLFIDNLNLNTFHKKNPYCL